MTDKELLETAKKALKDTLAGIEGQLENLEKDKELTKAACKGAKDSGKNELAALHGKHYADTDQCVTLCLGEKVKLKTALAEIEAKIKEME